MKVRGLLKGRSRVNTENESISSLGRPLRVTSPGAAARLSPRKARTRLKVRDCCCWVTLQTNSAG